MPTISSSIKTPNGRCKQVKLTSHSSCNISVVLMSGVSAHQLEPDLWLSYRASSRSLHNNMMQESSFNCETMRQWVKKNQPSNLRGINALSSEGYALSRESWHWADGTHDVGLFKATEGEHETHFQILVKKSVVEKTLRLCLMRSDTGKTRTQCCCGFDSIKWLADVTVNDYSCELAQSLCFHSDRPPPSDLLVFLFPVWILISLHEAQR